MSEEESLPDDYVETHKLLFFTDLVRNPIVQGLPLNAKLLVLSGWFNVESIVSSSDSVSDQSYTDAEYLKKKILPV